MAGTYSGTGTDGKSLEVVIQVTGHGHFWSKQGQPEVRGTWTGDWKRRKTN